ncbi:hypothetical protein MOTE_18760 [Moorella thermoacetica]|uniref:Uncharacterized protein n=1 Tax=Neomoorella thermoacetica TaxID=1525 RepID=A0A1J5NI33_NEOTH|nr:hypothetical protein MOTE_18760 [Moorella thermoacetica]
MVHKTERKRLGCEEGLEDRGRAGEIEVLNLFKKKPRVTMKPAPGQCPKCSSHI